MKWPNSLTFIRHGESTYNYLRVKKQENSDYKIFCELFDKEFSLAQDEDWLSEELKTLAKNIWQDTKLSVSDYNTPLTDEGFNQARKTGEALIDKINLPDVIYISPYLRTR